MKKKTRVFALLIAALLLAACAKTETPDNTPNNPQENMTNTETTSETDTETETEIPDNLPETDLDGYDYRIFAIMEPYIAMVYADEQTGSAINDAVYSKISTVEDRFNCNIRIADCALADDADNTTPIKQAILANEDTFDIATSHDISMAKMSMENCFVNLYDVPHLDFTKPWWLSFTIDSLTVNGRMYLFSNNISYEYIADTRVMFFNKDILKNMGQDMPYEAVYNGTWTMDVLNSLSAQAYVDVNGNGAADEDDQFGFVQMPYFYAFLEPFRVEPYQEDESGNLVYVFDLEKYQKIADKFYDLCYGGGGMISLDYQKIFANGDALFIYDRLDSAVTLFSQTDLSYGVLPMPKLDETQDGYYGGFTDRPYGIPVTATGNLDTIGIITEALSAEGYRKVFPVYFEQALKSRYADQSDDAQMIDIVCKNDILAFSYLYGNESPYNVMLDKLMDPAKPTTDVASYAAKIEGRQQKRVAALNEFFHQ